MGAVAQPLARTARVRASRFTGLIECTALELPQRLRRCAPRPLGHAARRAAGIGMVGGKGAVAALRDRMWVLGRGFERHRERVRALACPRKRGPRSRAARRRRPRGGGRFGRNPAGDDAPSRTRAKAARAAWLRARHSSSAEQLTGHLRAIASEDTVSGTPRCLHSSRRPLDIGRAHPDMPPLRRANLTGRVPCGHRGS